MSVMTRPRWNARASDIVTESETVAARWKARLSVIVTRVGEDDHPVERLGVRHRHPVGGLTPLPLSCVVPSDIVTESPTDCAMPLFASDAVRHRHVRVVGDVDVALERDGVAHRHRSPPRGRRTRRRARPTSSHCRMASMSKPCRRLPLLGRTAGVAAVATADSYGILGGRTLKRAPRSPLSRPM